MRGLGALLLLAAAATVAVAQDRIPREAFRMAPGLTNAQRYSTANRYHALHKQADQAADRVRRIDARLKQKPPAEEAGKLKAEREKLRKQIPDLRRLAEERPERAGVAPEAVERMRRFPTGALAEERYNHGLLLEAPGLTRNQEAIARHAIAAADAAQITSLTQQRRVGGVLGKADKVVRQQVNSGFGRQRREVEKRFWQFAYFLLTPAQMRHVRTLLSPRYAYQGDLENKIQILPGLAPSQASRVRALFAELESESAADSAAVRQLRARLRDKSLKGDKRGKMQASINESNSRLAGLRGEFVTRVRAVLTKDQLAALRAFPPQLSAADLRQPSQRVFSGLPTRPGQSAEMEKRRRAVSAEVRTLQRESAAGMRSMSMGEFGPESPQQMTMMMMRRNFEGEVIARRHALVHGALLDVLEPDQIAIWIAAPQTDRRP